MGGEESQKVGGGEIPGWLFYVHKRKKEKKNDRTISTIFSKLRTTARQKRRGVGRGELGFFGPRGKEKVEKKKGEK